MPCAAAATAAAEAPPWPCAAAATAFKGPGYLAIQYFGSGEVQALNTTAGAQGGMGGDVCVCVCVLEGCWQVEARQAGACLAAGHPASQGRSSDRSLPRPPTLPASRAQCWRMRGRGDGRRAAAPSPRSWRALSWGTTTLLGESAGGGQGAAWARHPHQASRHTPAAALHLVLAGNLWRPPPHPHLSTQCSPATPQTHPSPSTIFTPDMVPV
jgi:hypothetical protein